MPETARTLTAGQSRNWNGNGDIESQLIPSVAHTLRGEGFDASEDGTGRGVPLVPSVVGPLSANGGTDKKHGYGMGQQDWENGYAIPVVMATGQAGAEVVSDGEPSLTCNHEAPIVFDHARYDRFWKKVERTDKCWLWRGAVKDTGYGVFWFNGRIERAHRVSWELHHGPIPEGLCVLHKCDIRTCVNPDHLWLGSHADNNEDMAHKGRAIIPVYYGEKHGKAKLTDEHVAEIKASSLSGIELAKRYGVSRSTISSVRLGHTRNNGTSAMCMRMMEGKDGGGKGPLVSEDQSLTLATGNDQVLCAPTLTASNDPSRSPQSSEVTAQIFAVMQATGNDQVLAFQPRHYADRERMGGEPSPLCHTLSSSSAQGDSSPHVTTDMQVRRLTPVETSRLQGFPDTYCHIPTKKWRKIPADEAAYLQRHGLHAELRGEQWYTSVAADGPIYKANGNSWAVPVVRWIGERIELVNETQQQRA